MKLDLLPLNAPVDATDEQLVAAAIARDELRAIKLAAGVERGIALARQLFNLQMDVASSVPISHDFYFKLWQMSKPVLPYNYIMFDEAQDADALMLDIVNRQTHCKLIFVGDTNQQIFSWRGAVNAMDNIPNADEVLITKSFRFGDAIAELANQILFTYPKSLSSGFGRHMTFDNGDYSLLEGHSVIDSQIAKVWKPDAIICHTRFGIINEIVDYGDTSKIFVQGGTAEVIGSLRAAKDLIEKGNTIHPDFMLFDSWSDVVELSETDDGREYRQLVKLITRFDDDVSYLIRLLTGTAKDANHADVIVTTVHKAKGLEWDNVRLSNDFFTLEYLPDAKTSRDIINHEERNILYVAVTRAKLRLDVTGCRAISRVLSPLFAKCD